MSVVFQSDASNLVVDDTNGAQDLFLHDRTDGTTVLVSLTDAGTQSSGCSETPAASADLRHIAFVSTAPDLVADDTDAVRDVFARQR